MIDACALHELDKTLAEPIRKTANYNMILAFQVCDAVCNLREPNVQTAWLVRTLFHTQKAQKKSSVFWQIVAQIG